MKSDEREAESEAAASTAMKLAETAHELANVVTSIASGVDVALGLAETSRQRAVLEDVRHGVAHLILMVRRLRGAGPGELIIGVVDPDSALDGATRLAEPRLGPRMIIERIHGGTPVVRADEALLEQALLNLILNAIEAFPTESAGPHRIQLATSTDASGHATIEVEDNGPGIPVEALTRVFEPHYTTKPGGSGLGLPLCQRTIASMGGTLSVESQPGRTSFVIILPPAVE